MTVTLSCHGQWWLSPPTDRLCNCSSNKACICYLFRAERWGDSSPEGRGGAVIGWGATERSRAGPGRGWTGPAARAVALLSRFGGQRQAPAPLAVLSVLRE